VTSGFCATYCGKHSKTTINGVTIKYGIIGNAISQCPGSCVYQPTSPNGDAGVDGMISVIAHQLADIVTDPLSDAWWDTLGNEVADKCNFNFGSGLFRTSNGAIANVALDGKNFLIQQIWNPVTGKCVMQ